MKKLSDKCSICGKGCARHSKIMIPWFGKQWLVRESLINSKYGIYPIIRWYTKKK